MAREKGSMIARGRTSETFTWGDGQILKLFLDWCPATDVEREAKSTQAVRQAGIPVPAVKGIVKVDGRLGIAFERIEGPSMLAETISKPWKLFRFARILAELQAAVHSCEVSELRSQRLKLEGDIQRTDLLTENIKEVILKALAELPDGSMLCHGDFHPDNIIMSSHGPIIIDWLDATQGNTLGDLARTWLLLRLGVPLHTPPGRWLISYARTLFHSIYLRRYIQLQPTSRKQIAAWLLPVAAARLAENISEEEKDRLLNLVEVRLKYQR